MEKRFRASFYTVGCRLNQAETALIARGFEEKGYQIVRWGQETDLCVINTCAVTEGAEADCRQAVRGILRSFPQACVVLTGCLAQVESDTLRQISGVDVIAGTDYKMDLPNLISGPTKLSSPLILRSRKISRENFAYETTGFYDEKTRPNLKIQDGCDFFCTFCIVPFSRGRERSRAFDDILREASGLAAQGHTEIVLTGANLGRYSHGGKTLVDVIKGIEEIEGIARIRLSSMEPTTLSRDVIEHMARSEKLCPHLHLPLQSGDDRILKGMNRRYSVAEYRSFVDWIVTKVPDVGLGTDLIAGFPGEDEEAFHKTVACATAIPFSYLHVFPFSPRRGTKGARLPGRVVKRTIRARTETLLRLASEKKKAFYQGMRGKRLKVLFESRDERGIFTGFSGNYIRVGVMTSRDLTNQIREVMVTDVVDGLALGVLST